jgi:hypothetical protein
MADRDQLPWRIPVSAPLIPAVEEVLADMEAILRSGRLTKGPYLDRLEAAVAERLGVRHAVAVSSCTTGLMLVYRGLAGAGRGRGRIRDEVVMPSFTFLAAPAAAVWSGLKPVFIDVDPATTNITPADVARVITARTAAICGCHTFGNPCDVTGLERVADAHGLPLVMPPMPSDHGSTAGRWALVVRPRSSACRQQNFLLPARGASSPPTASGWRPGSAPAASMAMMARTIRSLPVSMVGCPN